jgi:predicted nucleic acid-binding protein
MAVVDASVFVDALVGMGVDGQPARAQLRDKTVLHVRQFGAEACSALRALVARGELSQIRAALLLEAMGASDFSHAALAQRLLRGATQRARLAATKSVERRHRHHRQGQPIFGVSPYRASEASGFALEGAVLPSSI